MRGASENSQVAHRKPVSAGTRPVIRWIKGDGLDDPVTRTAIDEATRLFGDSVDYCLCTVSLTAARVLASSPGRPSPSNGAPSRPTTNPALAAVLFAAVCDAGHFGYGWKWFPERVRPGAPEWVLDGDMVVAARPARFEAWKA